MKQYCCFLMAERIGENVVDPLTVEYVTAPVGGKYCVIMSEHPTVFHISTKIEATDEDPEKIEIEVDDDGDPVYRGTFSIGWDNLPTWRFDPESQEFSPFDPHTNLWFQRWERRKKIDSEIRVPIKQNTEFKSVRKAILAIIETFPQLKGHPDIQAYLNLSDTITSRISRHPKAYYDGVDLKQNNGVSESRLKALWAHGVDYGPTKKEMVADGYQNGGADELKKRAEMHTIRRQKEKEINDKGERDQ